MSHPDFTVEGRVIDAAGITEHARIEVTGSRISSVTPLDSETTHASNEASDEVSGQAPSASGSSAMWSASDMPTIIPGFVDLHNHGGDGGAFPTGDEESCRRAAEFHRRHGTTTLLASLVSANEQEIVRQLDILKPLADEGLIAGVHLEGPFVNAHKCGAQNPDRIVPADADMFARAASRHPGLIRQITPKMRNMGEACTAANRFIVHESVAEEFSKKLAEAMGDLTCGNGLDEGTTCGPLIEKKALDNVAALVDDAKEKGAKVLCGGEPLEGKGYFYKPTVLYPVPTDARVFGEEIFGPVAPITTFSTESQALELANDTEYGLSSYLFTTNVQRALRFSEDLEAGMAGLNVGVLSNAAAPFGGVKQSGLGREGGNAGIEEYQEVRYIAMPTE